MTSEKINSGIGKYLLEFGSAMAIYVVVLFAAIPLRDGAATDATRLTWALAPVLPLVFVFLAIIRQYNRSDELQQRMHSEAFALGAIILGFGVTIWGFAETAGYAALPTILVAPALIGLWGICLPFVMRKYR